MTSTDTDLAASADEIADFMDSLSFTASTTTDWLPPEVEAHVVEAARQAGMPTAVWLRQTVEAELNRRGGD